MNMTPYRARIRPLSAFGTRPLGDTLFGQLCWAFRNRHGEDRLAEVLAGYTEDRPYAVVSDALPTGHWPRPALPSRCFDIPGEDRKAVKKLAWLPAGCFDNPVGAWLAHSLPPGAVPGAAPESHPQPHNSLNRETGTTGTDFAPYAMEQWWFDRKPKESGGAVPEVWLDVYVVLDETRLSAADLRILLDDIGAVGFGRDASIGLGKFAVEGDLEPVELPGQPDADAWLTLAPSAPQDCGFDPERSFYQPFTRFGRHGDIGVHLPGGPFKAPVLLAQTGAVLTPREFAPRRFVGRGLGGEKQPLSKTIPGTVHQGYAPVLGIRLPEPKDTA